jgi:hypothetical protein
LFKIPIGEPEGDNEDYVEYCKKPVYEGYWLPKEVLHFVLSIGSPTREKFD